MRAIDSNVIIRLIVNDNEDQVERARRLIEGETVLVATTVLLETNWVLKSTYGLGKSVILMALRAFTSHRNVRLIDGDVIEQALTLAESGLSIEDSFHVAASSAASSFVTFDGPLFRGACKIASIRVEKVDPL